jgi:hypothetical protein
MSRARSGRCQSDANAIPPDPKKISAATAICGHERLISRGIETVT